MERNEIKKYLDDRIDRLVPMSLKEDRDGMHGMTHTVAALIQAREMMYQTDDLLHPRMEVASEVTEESLLDMARSLQAGRGIPK